MNSGASATSPSEPLNSLATAAGDDWAEFCERHARAAAADFAKAFCTYVNLDLTESARASLSYRDFLRKFVETFCDHFEAEYVRRTKSPSTHDANSRQPTSNDREGNSTNHNNRTPVRTSSHEEFSDYSEQDGEIVSPKPAHKPFFRRLSFKGLKKGKGLFHKQQSDEVVLSHPDSRRTDKHSKAKLSKIVVECRKEGTVNAMVIENTDVPQKFEKCRLALVKASAGYMLEFCSSSKAKPRHGIFCSSITEARETTALEMPDHENTFVLKTLEREFIIEAKDPNDMRSWLATIRYCMRNTYGLPNLMGSGANDTVMVESMMHGSASMNIEGDRVRANSASKSTRSALDHVDEQGNPPELPPRLRARSNSNLELCSSQQEIEQIPGAEVEVDLSSSLREYPWFHGTLPRSDAAQLVLHNATEGHGTFLVRQSETRKGEYVLTFNFQGRAKHLRMTLTDQGHCRVQHLSFPAIYDMLDHFRQNPIPLESGGTADVKLTEYVVANQTIRAASNTQQSAQSSTAQQQPQQQPDRRPAAAPEPREVQTYGGSIRMRAESLERLEQQHQQQQQNNANGEQQASTSRAVQNAYSFL
ncbi:SH2B adapter protein 1 [Nasonia vitripennis]|uniref:SH2B adapter protein 1 n=1 Tax=Nasonia vitripennis TaxID=7425 RepID=A0A7M7IXA8_NASVI|nr:SH2B adapter protein 1 [Nasonia vitripennis]